MCEHCRFGSIPSGGCHMCIELTVAPAPATYLGSIDDKGRILATHGWAESGSAWVTDGQKMAATSASWMPTGRTQEFLGSTLYEVFHSTKADQETGR